MLRGLQFCVLAKTVHTVGTVQARGPEGSAGGSAVESPPAHAGVIPDLEDTTCHRAAEHVPQLLSLCSRAGGLQLLKPALSGARAPQQEKPPQ